MKKIVLLAALAFGVMSAQAQDRVVALPSAGSNWQIGIDGGAIAPMQKDDLIKNVRGGVGLHIDKMLSPVFGLGVEGVMAINTSTANHGLSNKLTCDQTYVGSYGKINLFNLFGGVKCDGRFFDMDVVAGAGWGRDWYHHSDVRGGGAGYYNYFSTKFGMNFNFNLSKVVTLSLKPSLTYRMTGANMASHTSACYNSLNAQMNLFASLSVNINRGFNCVRPYDQAEVDGLNARINGLRGELDACTANTAALQAKINKLQSELDACNARPAVVQEVVTNNNNSVRYVFFKIGSSVITNDQMPNVEMIAQYLKNHKDAKVVIKGYASKDGNPEFNKKLAQKRAESVKNSLIKKYKVAADRIVAEGEGIGNMFEEESWNRVAICTLENNK